MLKEFYADYMRWRADQKENSRPCTIIVRGEGDDFREEEVRCDQIRVGDVVKLGDGDIAPADLLILTTRDGKGEAFNKTTSLDGETNLKPKLALRQVNGSFFGIKRARLSAHCHQPIADLYRFNARVEYGNDSLDADLKQFMHRGASLQNSEKICGLVVHTSTDCKLIMNQGKYGFKQSKLYKGINALMVFNIVLILCIAAVFAALNYSFVTDN